MSFTRRTFVRTVPTFGAFIITSTSTVAAQPAEPSWPSPPPAPGAPVDDSFPSHHPYLAKEMVGVAHSNLARVTELVKQYPALAKASWDWGFGDWESALGAASHVGNRPIAELLLENGAPPTLFSATMLGQLDIVKAWLTAVPDALHLRGPHGISLIAHAQAGGAQAAPVLQYLQSLGPQRANPIEPLSADDRAALEGTYTFGARPRDRFIVDVQNNQLGIVRPGATRRGLFHLGKLEFYPTGAPRVKIRFDRSEGAASALTLLDPDPVVRATRAKTSV
jgi:hypothetical protein